MKIVCVEIPKGIALTFSIINVNKEFCNYEGESFKWGYMTDEHRNSMIFLIHGEVKIGVYTRSSKGTEQLKNKK